MKEEQNITGIQELLTIAQEYMRDKQITAALNILQEANRIEPEDSIVQNLMATCYLTLGEHTRALNCWEYVLEQDPGNKTARNSLEIFHSPAIQFWIKRYHEALREMEKKNFAAAGKILHQLLEENDGQVRLFQLLGLCYLAANDHDKAVLAWNKGLAVDKSNPELMEYLKSVEAKQSKPPVTPENMNKIADKKPRTVKGKLIWTVSAVLMVLILGVFINAHGTKPDKTEKNQYASKKVDNQPAPVITTEASKLQAIPVSRQLNDGEDTGGAAYDTEKEEYYYMAGRKAYLKRDWENAINNFSMVVDMHTYSYLNREALYYLARSNYLTGSLNEAERNYTKYLKEFPDSNYYDDSLYYLGCVYYQQQDQSKAREMFSQLKSISPNSGYLLSANYMKVMK